ncbi:MAG: DUF4276 family protein [Verrucomicrobiales bacterium]
MKRILILVEGATEERFVKDVLHPHFWALGIHPEPKIAATKRVKQGKDFTGGISSFQQVLRDLRLLCGDRNAILITTLIDYYGLPTDFPKPKAVSASAQENASEIEAAIENKIGDPRFKAFLMVHEFEAIAFVNPRILPAVMIEPGKQGELAAIRERFPSPEDINSGRETAPSKRISGIFPRYRKPLHGPRVALETGLPSIRTECPRFGRWISLLEGV